MQTMLVKYKKMLYLVTSVDRDDKTIYRVYKRLNDKFEDYVSHEHFIKFDGYKETWGMSLTPYHSLSNSQKTSIEGNLQ